MSTMAATSVDQVLDTKGLSCPLPVLRTKKAIKALEPGKVLKVLATDPGATNDFLAFCTAYGHQLLANTMEGDVFVFVIKKAA